MVQLTHAERQDCLSWWYGSVQPPVWQRSLHSTQRLPVMGLAASIHWISQRISRGNTDESESLRGRETVLGFHAGKGGHANAARLKSTASRTCSKDGEPYTLQGVRPVRRGLRLASAYSPAVCNGGPDKAQPAVRYRVLRRVR
jgi:hypothetical protein